MLSVGLRELRDHGLVAGSGEQAITVTEDGRRVMTALTEARRQSLEELLAGWNPQEHPELEDLVRRLAAVVMADDDRLLRAATPSLPLD